ncbi:hypothetical protein HF888_07085 [Bermanella marisrubri]|uniref:Peptidoglycan-binding protein CsiV n=1 Tax=Bermanella marisrubri TaxID=207949 RepID=Q1N540_9GAMM|nr:CsiV family protein [Bermanella marisrubri]EAT13238.1 hypothetical protein RED65_00720 [Oceanobacter sp. RED65] [Bermanella marisrubri]QIZ84006.1 hypothetical protein HF888_07085 [Bermanella marisrubri]
MTQLYMRTLVAYLSTALLTLGTPFSHAEDEQESVENARWYQVNITLFQQKSDATLDEEFSFKPVELDMGSIMQLHDGNQVAISNSGVNSPLALHQEAVNNHAFVKQNISEDWQNIVDRLDPVQQPVLINLQWSQPVYDKPHSTPIYLESSATHMQTPRLKGLFRLHVTRYLHGLFQVQYLGEDAKSIEETLSFSQSRRMRSGEIHYLDHPKLGVIMRAIPVTNPLKKSASEETDAEETLKNTEGSNQSVLNSRI